MCALRAESRRGFFVPTDELTCENWRRYLVSVCGDELGEDVADRAQRR